MDPYILSSLIGGGVVNLVIWGTLGFLVLRDKRRGKWGDQYGRKERRAEGVIDDSDYSPMFGRAVSDWERWFAWRPVHTLDRGWVFCRIVWRRRIVKKAFLPGPQTFWRQYLVKLRYVGV